MNMVTRFRFLLWYSHHDLWAKDAQRTTWTCFLTVGCLIGFSAIAQGFLGGYSDQQLKRYAKEPPCLWFEKKVPYGQRFNDTDLDQLPVILQEGLSQSNDYIGLSPFRFLKWTFLKVDCDYRLRDAQYSALGRTLDSRDRVFMSSLFDQPMPEYSPDAGGVWVTRTLWKDLDADRLTSSADPKLRIYTETASGDDYIELPILGVIEKPMPLGLQFVITEAQFRLTEVDQQVSNGIDTGPIPPEWKDQKPKALDAFLTINHLKLEPQKEIDVEYNELNYWRLKFIGVDQAKKLTRKRWEMRINDIVDRMKQANLPDAPQIATGLKMLDPVKAGARDEGGYHTVGAYFRGLDPLEPALKTLENQEYDVLNRDFVLSIAATKGIMRYLQFALSGITLGILVIAMLNVLVIQQLRSEMKITETGMLKAMGMDRRLLRDVFLMEAGILWVWSCVTAVVILAVAMLILYLCNQNPLIGHFAMAWPPGYHWLVLGTSLVLCLLTAWVATGKARGRSPMDSLRHD